MQGIFSDTDERLAQWKADPEVLGVLQVGSKSRGHGDERSDDDLEVVLTESAYAKLPPAECLDMKVVGEGAARRPIWEAQYLSLSEFDRKAASNADLDHWPYERAQIWFDRDGRLAEAVRRCAAMDAAFRTRRLQSGAVDALVAIRRGVKTRERGHEVAVKLLAGKAARALSRVVFALEWRWVPLDHWFEHEVRTLADRSGATPFLLEGIRTGTIEPFEQCLARLENALEPEGFPRDLAGRRALLIELFHISRREEREIHAIN